MNILIKFIPDIEFLFVLAMLGLGLFGYRSLLSKTNQFSQDQYKSAEKWVLSGLIGLAIFAIFLLLMVSLIQG